MYDRKCVSEKGITEKDEDKTRIICDQALKSQKQERSNDSHAWEDVVLRERHNEA